MSNHATELRKNGWKTLALVFIGLFIIYSAFFILNLKNSFSSDKEGIIKESFFNNFYKGIEEHWSGAYNADNGNYNLKLFSWSYENGYLDDAIDYCKASRDNFMASNECYHKAINYFKKANETAPEKYKERINLYIKISDIATKMNYASYESCEYLETASSHYLNGRFEEGNSNLEKANEKTRLRDSYVPTYNDYLAKLKVLENNP